MSRKTKPTTRHDGIDGKAPPYDVATVGEHGWLNNYVVNDWHRRLNYGSDRVAIAGSIRSDPGSHRWLTTQRPE